METNFILEADLVKREYVERLQEAERDRRFRQLKPAGLQARFWSNIGNYLISLGRRLKTRHQPDSAALSFK